MKLVSNLLLIFFILGLNFVCLPQKVLAVSDKARASFKLYELKAKQGDVNAQFNLALLYHQGSGTYDHRNAIYWYVKAAQQGHVQAQYKLGSLYHNLRYAEEVPQDSNRAVFWLTKAAEQGYVHAQYKLGHIYEYGDVASQDYKQAFFWYTKAAEQNHHFAIEDRGNMLAKMSQSQIEEVKKLSKELKDKMYNLDK